MTAFCEPICEGHVGRGHSFSTDEGGGWGYSTDDHFARQLYSTVLLTRPTRLALPRWYGQVQEATEQAVDLRTYNVSRQREEGALLEAFGGVEL